MAEVTPPSSAHQRNRPPADNPPITFKTAFKAEIAEIEKSRLARGTRTEKPAEQPPAKPTEKTLIGLAFSGGGIRSATFNLGILQALASKNLLHYFDYLSTVSGGGYVGSWLAALTRRMTLTAGVPFAEVERSLAPKKYEIGSTVEPPFVKWLRNYGNYLTPRVGLFSGDTWAAVGTWLRNVIVNLVVFILFGVGVLLLGHGLALAMVVFSAKHPGRVLVAGGITLFFAAVMMAVNMGDRQDPEKLRDSSFKRVKVTVTVILPFLAAGLLVNCGLWSWAEARSGSLWMWAGAGAIYYLLVWLISFGFARHRMELISPYAVILSSIFAGAIGGVLLYGYAQILEKLQSCEANNWLVVVCGTAAILLLLMLVAALHLGLMGLGCTDLVREWWARLGGYLMLVTLAWLALMGITAFAPLLVKWCLLHIPKISVSVVIAWVLSNWGGLVAAKSGHTNGRGKKAPSKAQEPQNRVSTYLLSRKGLEILARVAPYVFGVGLLLLLSTAVHIGTGLVSTPDQTRRVWNLHEGSIGFSCCGVIPEQSGFSANWTQVCDLYWQILRAGSWCSLLLAALVTGTLCLFMSWRVDVNEFSMHHFYRNRLVRCYLGASNPKRMPQPFTGFDIDDDVSLSDLANGYPGLYPLLNTALNITSGEELGFDKRKAKSFVFAPLYSGYDLVGRPKGARWFSAEDDYLGTYLLTEDGRSDRKSFTRGISLGTAMAISGAAASPNMGYHTAPATAFFMTLFAVRLGWWMGNPRYPAKWRSSGPTLGLAYLFSELLAQSDQQRGYVYLSDGGHFENLGVYELIKRRCRLIVACDADCDEQYEFEDLLSLIEKARADFDARIEIDFAQIRPKPGERSSGVNYAVGNIFYDPANPQDRATVIYIKASLPEREATPGGAPPTTTPQGGLPADVWRYAGRCKDFPHQTTADQWFDEIQFESYRALGEYIGNLAAPQIQNEIAAVQA
jgi:Patatin-like phospholipase